MGYIRVIRTDPNLLLTSWHIHIFKPELSVSNLGHVLKILYTIGTHNLPSFLGLMGPHILRA